MLTTLIAFLLLATVLSFFCSLWESVLLSITPSYAQIKIQQGTALGVQLRAFKENIDRPLAAILTLNTVAHTVGAIGVGQEATKIWADTSPLITGLLVPGLTTIVILIFSEIIPKTIGATHWQRLATFTVYCLKYVIWLLFPLVWLCQFATRRFKVSNEASLFSRSDFLAMTEIGAQEGVFEHTHSEMIKSLLAFDTVVVKSIMTPRTVVHRVSEDTTIKDYFNSRSCRFPAFPSTKLIAQTISQATFSRISCWLPISGATAISPSKRFCARLPSPTSRCRLPGCSTSSSIPVSISPW